MIFLGYRIREKFPDITDEEYERRLDRAIALQFAERYDLVVPPEGYEVTSPVE